MERREQERNELLARLTRLETQKDLTLTAGQIEEYLGEMHRTLTAKENESQLKALVQKFVNQVVVFETDLEIELRVSLVAIGSGGVYTVATKLAI